MNIQVSQSSFLHPILFAFFPVIFLFSTNYSFLNFDDLFYSSLLLVGITILTWFTLKLLFKNTKKSSIVLSLSLIFFFSYGHIQKTLTISGLELPNKVLLPIFLIIFILITIGIIRNNSHFKNWTKIINAIAFTIVIISLVNFVNIGSSDGQIYFENDQNLSPKFENTPNVFYIILDAYAGQQALQEFYNFDNSNFIDELNQRKFNVINKSNSNYAFTFLSLPSSLNMKYLDDYDKNELSNNMELTYDLIPNNQVMKNFKQMDYQIATVSSGWGTTRNFELSDISYCGTFNLIDSSQILVSILDNSIIKSFYTKLFTDDRRDKTLCQFDRIPNAIDDIEKPFFLFAHIMIPHKPYLFGPDGEPLETDTLEVGGIYEKRNFNYIKQLQFANKKTLELIDEIIRKSNEPPIIIIQSDHGSEYPENTTKSLKIYEKMHNFNSYHLPYGGESILYDGITPVNSFRLIFNYYFNGNYEILEDKSYWSESNPFDEEGYPQFIDVTQELKRSLDN